MGGEVVLKNSVNSFLARNLERSMQKQSCENYWNIFVLR